MSGFESRWWYAYRLTLEALDLVDAPLIGTAQGLADLSALSTANVLHHDGREYAAEEIVEAIILRRKKSTDVEPESVH